MTQWLPGTLRTRIQDLCRDRNITQSELAQQVEIDKSTLSRFLNEKTNKQPFRSLYYSHCRLL